MPCLQFFGTMFAQFCPGTVFVSRQRAVSAPEGTTMRLSAPRERFLGVTAARIGQMALMLVVCLGLGGCGDGDSKHSVQTEFSSAAGYDPTPPPPTPFPGSGAPGNPGGDAGTDRAERAIEEADIVKIVGNRLFALSRYRGLFVINLENRGLEIQSRVSLHGMPIELLVRDDRVVVLLDDVRDPVDTRTIFSQTYHPTRSEILLLDVGDPRAPRTLETVSVPGSIRDSRLVGDILYLVTRVQTLDDSGYGFGFGVESLDLRNPDEVTRVDRVAFDVFGYEPHIHVTDERIHVAYSGYDGGGTVTSIRVVDVSDRSGRLRLGDEILTAGYLTDRYQMDERDGILRVVLHSSQGNGQPVVRTFDVTDPLAVRALGELTLDLPRPESLTSVRFEGDLGYVVTYERIDPLFVVDLSDPLNPRQRGELEMTGWLDYIQPFGDRLVALGHDDSSGSLELAVSLIDVADPDNPRLLSRAPFGNGWIGELRDDFGKVFQVVPDLGLVLVPYLTWDFEGGFYSGTRGRLQLLDLDLTGDSITARGNLVHGSGIRRALLHEGDVLALSDSRAQRLDVSDRDLPVAVAEVDLARRVIDVAFTSDIAVQLVSDESGDEARLLVFSRDEPDAPFPLSEVELSIRFAPRLFVMPGVALVVGASSSSASDTVVEVVRLDGTRLERLTSVKVPINIYQALDTTGEGSFAVTRGEGWPFLAGSALVFRDAWPSTGFLVLDVSRPEEPGLVSVPHDFGDRIFSPSVSGAVLSFTTRAELAPVTSDDLATQSIPHELVRLDLSSPGEPVLRQGVNIPGHFLALDEDGHHALTIDFQWSGFQSLASLCVIDLVGNKAMLLERRDLGTAFAVDARVEGSWIYTAARRYSYYGGAAGGAPTAPGFPIYGLPANLTTWSRAGKSTLAAGARVELDYGVRVLAGVGDGTALLDLGYFSPGVAAADLASPLGPRVETTTLTIGSVDKVVTDGERSYALASWWGVIRVR